MTRRLCGLFVAATLLVLSVCLLPAGLRASEAPAPDAQPGLAPKAPGSAPAAKSPSLLPAPVVEVKARIKAVVVPVREAIDEPILYVLRRGLKKAIADKADVVVLDMDTPGGSLATTFEILEALEKFEGLTITYVNKEAISAGALISAGTHEIWFAPHSVIGAAAPVLSGGKDVEETMKKKIVSYLKARVRAISEGKGYRGEVISSMIDSEPEFKIGDKVIKPKGELLSLTDTEAIAYYGEPPQKLLGEGIARSVEALLESKYGADGYTVDKLEVTWSEDLAVWLKSISPLLMGLGLLAIFVELKTPGFGIFGVLGIVFLAVVFLSNFVAGLSGHEPLVLFCVGLLLVSLEIFVFPGLVVPGVFGLVLMFGSLVWSMADLWPNEPVSFSGDQFVRPLLDVGLGFVVALVLAVLLARFLPRGMLWDRMVVNATVDSAAQSAGGSPVAASEVDSLVGASGVVVAALHPSGQVEVGGRRYEARVEVGELEAGSRIVVRGRSDFGLVVEQDKTA